MIISPFSYLFIILFQFSNSILILLNFLQYWKVMQYCKNPKKVLQMNRISPLRTTTEKFSTPPLPHFQNDTPKKSRTLCHLWHSKPPCDLIIARGDATAHLRAGTRSPIFLSVITSHNRWLNALSNYIRRNRKNRQACIQKLTQN